MRDPIDEDRWILVAGQILDEEDGLVVLLADDGTVYVLAYPEGPVFSVSPALP